MFICLCKSDFLKRLIFHTKVLYFITAVHFGMRFGKGLAYYYIDICEEFYVK